MSRHPSAENPINSGLTCARVQRLLWDLVDGTLSLSREQAVRRHLERCAVCRGKWEACLKAERASPLPPHTSRRRATYFQASMPVWRRNLRRPGPACSH